jgi:putative serine/threonine protein kinase
MKKELHLLLDYPACREERALRILKELRELGVELLQFIAKGYRGTVFKGKLNGKPIAIKVKRSDVSKERLIEKECEILKYLEDFSKKTGEKNPAPKVYRCTGEYLIMEFINGLTFSRALKSLLACLRPLNSLGALLRQLKRTLLSCFLCQKEGKEEGVDLLKILDKGLRKAELFLPFHI